MKLLNFLIGYLNLLIYRLFYLTRLGVADHRGSYLGDINITSKSANVSIGKNFRSRKFCCLNISSGKLVIGNNVFFNRSVSLNCHSMITIGDNSLFGENVKVYDHDHLFNDKSKLIKEQGFAVADVSIGSNVWIGSNVVILKGSTIGDNSVIAAGSIVMGVIPNDSIFVQKRKSSLLQI